jgi:hypothetical protein
LLARKTGGDFIFDLRQAASAFRHHATNGGQGDEQKDEQRAEYGEFGDQSEGHGVSTVGFQSVLPEDCDRSVTAVKNASVVNIASAALLNLQNHPHLSN